MVNLELQVRKEVWLKAKNFSKVILRYTDLKTVKTVYRLLLTEVDLDKRIAHTFTVGKKKRPITVPTPEFASLLKAWHRLLKTLVGYSPTNSYGHPSTIQSTYIHTDNIYISACKNMKDIMTRYENVELKLVDTVIKYDLQKAFNSVTYSMWTKYIREVKIANRLSYITNHYSPPIVQEINATFTTLLNKMECLFVEGYLPQGFSTSPIIFNSLQENITQKVMKTILRLSKRKTEKHCPRCYQFYNTVCSNPLLLTRYADDFLLFTNGGSSTCKEHDNYWLMLLRRLYRKHGFIVNRRKFCVSNRANRRYIKFLGHSIIGNNVTRICLNRKMYKKISRAYHNKNPKPGPYINGIRGYAKTAVL